VTAKKTNTTPPPHHVLRDIKSRKRRSEDEVELEGMIAAPPLGLGVEGGVADDVQEGRLVVTGRGAQDIRQLDRRSDHGPVTHQLGGAIRTKH
jgi:hypothetical protein